MISLKDIQTQISEAIKESELSQAEIGKRCGISQQTVSHYLKGNKSPSIETFANLCVVLDLDAAEILCISAKNKIHK